MREFRNIYTVRDGSRDNCEIRVEHFAKGWCVQVLEGGEVITAERRLSSEEAQIAYKAREQETLDQGFVLVSEETFNE